MQRNPHRRHSTLAAWLVCLAVSLLTARSASAGEAWALEPTPRFSGPLHDHSFNPTGADNTVSYDRTGVYVVRFPGLTRVGGNVQVSAYGSGPVRCKTSGWGPSGGQIFVNVRCHAPDGRLADSQFVVWFVEGDALTPNLGYVLATLPRRASYEPPSIWQFNPEGGVNTVRRSGTGTYDVTFPGMAAIHSTAHVTAYGDDGSHCKVGGWGAVSGGTSVRVVCFDTTGHLVDRLFSLRYTVARESASPSGFVRVGNTTKTSFIPSLDFQHNRTGARNVAGWSGFRAEVSYTGLLDVPESVALTTAFGLDPGYCKLTGWGSTPVRVRSICFKSHGTSVRTRFTESYHAASCIVPELGPGVTGASGATGCMENQPLPSGTSCDLTCAPDHLPAGGGTGSGHIACELGVLTIEAPRCERHVGWQTGAWSSCMDYRSTRTLSCIGHDTGAVFDSTVCDAFAPEPRPITSQICGGTACVSFPPEHGVGSVATCLFDGTTEIGCEIAECVGTDAVAGSGCLTRADGVRVIERFGRQTCPAPNYPACGIANSQVHPVYGVRTGATCVP